MDNINEFEEKGFVPSDVNLRKILRYHGEQFKIFNSGTNPKYASYEIFGDSYFIYYYDTRREKEFVDFLVEKFYDKNPSPNREMKAAFTRILHHHNLCWHGCYHTGKKTLKDEEEAINNRRD